MSDFTEDDRERMAKWCEWPDGIVPYNAICRLFDSHEQLRAEQKHNRLVIAQHEEHLGRVLEELTEARRLLDEARTTLVGIATVTPKYWELPRDQFIDEFLPWAQSRARDAAAKIAAPLPAQPAKRTAPGPITGVWIDEQTSAQGDAP